MVVKTTVKREGWRDRLVSGDSDARKKDRRRSVHLSVDRMVEKVSFGFDMWQGLIVELFDSLIVSLMN